MNVARSVLPVLVLAACGTPYEGPLGTLGDTGWFEAEDLSSCAAVVSSVDADGHEGWYWRRQPVVTVGEPGQVYRAQLAPVDGASIPVTLEPDDSGLNLTVAFEGGLAPNTEHVLEVTDCEGPKTWRFTTSSAGLPLDDGPRSLLGRSWVLDLDAATWVEPGGVGDIIATGLETEILMGVQWADASNLDWLGGPGENDLGVIDQEPCEETWDFPLSDFADAPWFDTRADAVTLVVLGWELPITDFRYTGTFLPDGSRIVGGTLEGLGDTRELGGLLAQPNNPAAICDFASGLGVPCQACPDGEDYCLAIEIIDLPADEVDDLTMIPVDPEELQSTCGT